MDSTQVVDKHKFNKSRSEKVSLRHETTILQEVCKFREEFELFGIKMLRLVSGLGNKACNEAARNLL